MHNVTYCVTYGTNKSLGDSQGISLDINENCGDESLDRVCEKVETSV